MPMEGYRPGAAPRYGPRQLGLFATARHFAGEVILSEEPLLSMKSAGSAKAVTRAYENFFDAVRALSKESLGRFKKLAFRTNDSKPAAELKRLLDRLSPGVELPGEVELLALRAFFKYSNPATPHEEVGLHRLFLDTCMINHSCTPNASTRWDDEDEKMVVRAMLDIEVGEEITVSYLMSNPFEPKEDRHRGLGFVCKCEICCKDEPNVSEDVYSDIGVMLRGAKDSRQQMQYASLPDPDGAPNSDVLHSVAHLLGSPRHIRQVAQTLDQFQRLRDIQHEDLTMVYNVHATAAWAWLMTHPGSSAVERDRWLQEAMEAKAREIKVASACHGLHDSRTVQALCQLRKMVMTLSVEDGGQKMCQALWRVGFGAAGKLQSGILRVWIRNTSMSAPGTMVIMQSS